MSINQFKIDMAEVRSLAADMTRVDSRLTRHAIPVVRKAAVNIKDAMNADFGKSRSFGALQGTVSFDEIDGGFGAEIGPTKRSGSKRGLDFGANIAYFGSYKGGGTVRDPWHALEDEYPSFIKHLEDVAGELILGD